VQSTIAPPDTREVGADTFDPATNKTIRQTKLRVLLVSTHGVLHRSLSLTLPYLEQQPCNRHLYHDRRHGPDSQWQLQVGPPKPPSPVPEGIEEEASPAKVATYHDDSSAAAPDPYAQERSRLRADLQKVRGSSINMLQGCSCLLRCVASRPGA
jgi:hypothetical protein